MQILHIKKFPNNPKNSAVHMLKFQHLSSPSKSHPILYKVLKVTVTDAVTLYSFDLSYLTVVFQCFVLHHITWTVKHLKSLSLSFIYVVQWNLGNGHMWINLPVWTIASPQHIFVDIRNQINIQMKANSAERSYLFSPQGSSYPYIHVDS